MYQKAVLSLYCDLLYVISGKGYLTKPLITAVGIQVVQRFSFTIIYLFVPFQATSEEMILQLTAWTESFISQTRVQA